MVTRYSATVNTVTSPMVSPAVRTRRLSSQAAAGTTTRACPSQYARSAQAELAYPARPAVYAAATIRTPVAAMRDTVLSRRRASAACRPSPWPLAQCSSGGSSAVTLAYCSIVHWAPTREPLFPRYSPAERLVVTAPERASGGAAGGPRLLPQGPCVGQGPGQHPPQLPPRERSGYRRPRVRASPGPVAEEEADGRRHQPDQPGKLARLMPQQGQVIGGQAGGVAAQLGGRPRHVVAVVVAGQRRGLVGDPVPGQQEHGQGERVLRGVRGRPGAQGDVETADPRQGLPPESHVRPDPEGRQWVERALRAMPRERGRREAAALAVAAELLEHLLSGSVQAGRQEHAAAAADIRSTREAAGQPGQPVPVGFLIIIEERDDVAGRRRDPGVARPRQPGTGFG